MCPERTDPETGQLLVTTYDYESDPGKVTVSQEVANQVVLIQTIQLGGDGELGTQDDLLVMTQGLSETGELIRTDYDYSVAGQVTINQQINGEFDAIRVVELGGDGEYGTDDDLLVHLEFLDEQGRRIVRDYDYNVAGKVTITDQLQTSDALSLSDNALRLNPNAINRHGRRFIGQADRAAANQLST